MSFLIDTDIFSAHMRRPGALSHRFIQHSGGVAVSSVTLAELYAGAYKHSRVNQLLELIGELMRDVDVFDFDADCAKQFGQIRGGLLLKGISVPTTDLMIAATALVHDRTLVTHNTADYRFVSNLRSVDWL